MTKAINNPMEKKVARGCAGGVARGCVKGGETLILSTVQKDILECLTKEHLTVKQIARRRETSEQAVRKTRLELRRMGLLSGGVAQPRIGAQPAQPSSAVWELHGCAWRCPIHEGKNGERYRRAVGAGVARVRVRDCTVELHRDVVEVHADVDFRAGSPEGATALSWAYLWRVLDVVENDYRLILRKERCPIRRFRGHYPHLDDEMAKHPGGAEIEVYAGDGKLLWIVDWSKKVFPELEALHSQLGEGKAGEYAAFLADLSNREHLNLSKLSELAVLFQAQLAFLAQREAHTQVALGVVAEQQAASIGALKILLDALTPKESVEKVESVERPFYLG